jgi:hypothetical protein
VEVARLEKAGRLIFQGSKPNTEAEKAALGDKIVFSPDETMDDPKRFAGTSWYAGAILLIGEPMESNPP